VKLVNTDSMRRSLIVVGLILVAVMGIFSFFEDNDRQGEASGQLPWHGRTAIYDHIRANLDESGKKLNEAGDSLPDEEVQLDKTKMEWVSGALDGSMVRNWGTGGDKETAKRIADLVISVSRQNATADRVALYGLLMKAGVLDYVDPALEQIVKAGVLRQPYLNELSRFLATKSPDRGPVKFGIALLGVIGDETNKDIVVLLGRHEEFSLYSAVALTNMLADPDDSLWDLAKSVDGWGRIELVEWLSKTKNPAIKRWLLREGYRNNIMYEYTVYTCATAGDLRSAITADEVDDELLSAAGDIIDALVDAWPAKDMDDYEDAAAVVGAYLRCVAPKASDLEQYLIVRTIQDYLEDEDWNPEAQRKNGWDDTVRREALRVCHSILSRPDWQERVREGLNSEDEQVVDSATMVAEHLGIDTWDVHWRRLQEKPLERVRWLIVIHGASPERAQMALTFALEVLPLDKVATGPAEEMGLEKEYEVHSCLGFIVHELGRYPGEGWPLIAAALRSPVVRNRNMALKALYEWGQERWPAEAADALKTAELAEPNEDVRERIRKVIAGEDLDLQRSILDFGHDVDDCRKHLDE